MISLLSEIRGRSLALCAFAFFATAFSFGCAAVPPGRFAVDTVSVTGNKHEGETDIEDKIATTESPRFLTFFEGVVYDYQIFDRFVLARDLQRIERFYRARGYYDAHARAARIHERVNYRGIHEVEVTIVVEEGEPINVRTIVLTGDEGLAADIKQAAVDAMNAKLAAKDIFDEDKFADAEAAARRALTDRGYAFAKSTRNAKVGLPRHVADIEIHLIPGEIAKYGKITVTGLNTLPSAPVLRALNIEEGQPYSTEALESAQQAVLDLGVFSNVQVTPDLKDPSNPIIPLTLHVEETKLHSLLLGGGIELDPIRTDVHITTGWENRNFLGGLRRFQVTLRPGVQIYPTTTEDFSAPNRLLPEVKLHSELHQPGFIEARTNGLIRGEANIFPVAFAHVPAGQPVLGYAEEKAAVGVDRQIWKFYVSPTYNIQDDQPFAYVNGPLANIGPVLMSYLDLDTRFDFRDNPVHPRKGIYIGNDFQFAGLGGDARDFRDQPELRAYVPLTDDVVLAAHGTLGFLFPTNNERLPLSATNPAVPMAPGDTASINRAEQLDLFRGFFSGGATSNRGYALRGIGPYRFVPFLNPTVALNQFENMCTAKSTNPLCKSPIGGFSLWELSLEARIHVSGPIEIGLFCDSSDVSADEVHIRLNEPHLSCGVGLRYDTPVGPVRLDLGYRIPGAQRLGQAKTCNRAQQRSSGARDGSVHPLRPRRTRSAGSLQADPDGHRLRHR
jgi:outer membrane protein assembly factor BamA